MAKRSASTMPRESSAASDTISDIVRRAEDLLRAARSLQSEIDADRHVDSTQLLAITDRIMPAIESLSKSTAKRQKKEEARNDQHQNGHQAPLEIPRPLTLTAWSVRETEGPWPPAPRILDPALSKAAVTHAGAVGKGELTYERLEWLGDAYLYLLSTAWIYQTFPHLSTGRSAQLRERCIKNMTLATYSQHYRLDAAVKVSYEMVSPQRKGGRASEQTHRKFLGDLFEAYVAGVILADPKQGLDNVASWMKALWGQELASEIQQTVKAPHAPQQSGNEPDGRDLPAKVRLGQAIAVKGIRINYKDERSAGKEMHSSQEWYTVGAYLNGWGETNKCLGVGSAMSKREAGEKAAEAALASKAIARYRKLKEQSVAEVPAGPN